jgi:hypothetical protein
LILAQWFKQSYKDTKSQVASKIDTKDLSNLTSKVDWDKNVYFKAYQKSFKDGEYNIQETRPSASGQTIRTYFSGGTIFSKIREVMGIDKMSPKSELSFLSSIKAALPDYLVKIAGNEDNVGIINGGGISEEAGGKLPAGRTNTMPLSDQQKDGVLKELLNELNANRNSAPKDVILEALKKLNDIKVLNTRAQLNDLKSFIQKKLDRQEIATMVWGFSGFAGLFTAAIAMAPNYTLLSLLGLDLIIPYNPILIVGGFAYIVISASLSIKSFFTAAKLNNLSGTLSELGQEPGALDFLGSATAEKTDSGPNSLDGGMATEIGAQKIRDFIIGEKNRNIHAVVVLEMSSAGKPKEYRCMLIQKGQDRGVLDREATSFTNEFENRFANKNSKPKLTIFLKSNIDNEEDFGRAIKSLLFYLDQGKPAEILGAQPGAGSPAIGWVVVARLQEDEELINGKINEARMSWGKLRSRADLNPEEFAKDSKPGIKGEQLAKYDDFLAGKIKEAIPALDKLNNKAGLEAKYFLNLQRPSFEGLKKEKNKDNDEKTSRQDGGEQANELISLDFPSIVYEASSKATLSKKTEGYYVTFSVNLTAENKKEKTFQTKYENKIAFKNLRQALAVLEYIENKSSNLAYSYDLAETIIKEAISKNLPGVKHALGVIFKRDLVWPMSHTVETLSIGQKDNDYSFIWEHRGPLSSGGMATRYSLKYSAPDSETALRVFQFAQGEIWVNGQSQHTSKAIKEFIKKIDESGLKSENLVEADGGIVKAEDFIAALKRFAENEQFVLVDEFGGQRRERVTSLQEVIDYATNPEFDHTGKKAIADILDFSHNTITVFSPMLLKQALNELYDIVAERAYQNSQVKQYLNVLYSGSDAIAKKKAMKNLLPVLADALGEAYGLNRPAGAAKDVGINKVGSFQTAEDFVKALKGFAENKQFVLVDELTGQETGRAKLLQEMIDYVTNPKKYDNIGKDAIKNTIDVILTFFRNAATHPLQLNRELDPLFEIVTERTYLNQQVNEYLNALKSDDANVKLEAMKSLLPILADAMEKAKAEQDGGLSDLFREPPPNKESEEVTLLRRQRFDKIMSTSFAENMEDSSWWADKIRIEKRLKLLSDVFKYISLAESAEFLKDLEEAIVQIQTNRDAYVNKGRAATFSELKDKYGNKYGEIIAQVAIFAALERTLNLNTKSKELLALKAYYDPAISAQYKPIERNAAVTARIDELKNFLDNEFVKGVLKESSNERPLGTDGAKLAQQAIRLMDDGVAPEVACQDLHARLKITAGTSQDPSGEEIRRTAMLNESRQKVLARFEAALAAAVSKDGGSNKEDVIRMQVRVFYKTGDDYSNIVSYDDGFEEFLDWLKVPSAFKYHEAIHIDNNLNEWIKAKGVELPEFLQIMLNSGFQPINERENKVIGKEAIIFNTIEIYPAFNEKGEISSDSVFVRAGRLRADGRVYFPTREIKLKNLKLEVPKGMTIKEILPDFKAVTVRNDLESQAKDGGNSVTEEKTDASSRPGGIDFRALPITTQPMGEMLMKEIINMPAINVTDLDQEWQALQKMIETDACPSTQRVKEFLGACYQKGELKQRSDKVLACLAGILRIEEDECKATEPQVKVMLALLEYNR